MRWGRSLRRGKWSRASNLNGCGYGALKRPKEVGGGKDLGTSFAKRRAIEEKTASRGRERGAKVAIQEGAIADFQTTSDQSAVARVGQESRGILTTCESSAWRYGRKVHITRIATNFDWGICTTCLRAWYCRVLGTSLFEPSQTRAERQ